MMSFLGIKVLLLESHWVDHSVPNQLPKNQKKTPADCNRSQVIFSQGFPADHHGVHAVARPEILHVYCPGRPVSARQGIGVQTANTALAGCVP